MIGWMPQVARILGRNRAFAVAAVVSIALAVGANAAIFSIVNALWIRPLPVAEPDRIAVPYRPVVHSLDGELLDHVPAIRVRQLRELDAFASVAYELHTRGLMALWEPAVRTRDGDRALSAAIVSHDYFSTLGVAIRGRQFTPEDERPSAEIAAIVSDDFWRIALDSDPRAIGRTIDMMTGTIRIVGIAPRHFRGARVGEHRDLWLPLAGLHFSDLGASPGTERYMPVTAYGRLRDGVSLAVAEEQSKRVIDRRTTLRSLRELTFPLHSAGDLSRQSAVVRVLWATALFVLLIGCANLAALVVARAEARGHELSVRRCLGATSRHLVLTALNEAVVLCVLGLAGGLIVRHWLLATIAEFQVPAGVSVESLDTRMDWRVLAFGAAVSVIATTIASAGTLPTLVRRNLLGLMATSATTGTRRTVRIRQSLLASHIALCTALLGAGAGLAWNVWRAMQTNFGYDSGSVLFVTLRPRLSNYDRLGEVAGQRKLASDMLRAVESVRGLPHVRASAYGAQLLGAFQIGQNDSLRTEDGAVRTAASVSRVGPGFLTAIGAQVVAGRDLGDADLPHAIDPMEVVKRQAIAASGGNPYRPPSGTPAAVLDAALAGSLWPGEPPVGKTFVRTQTGVRYVVAGVVAPIRYSTGGDGPLSMFEVQAPEALDVLRPQHFVVRTGGHARSQRAAVIAAFRAEFPDALHLSVRDAASWIAEERARERMGARVFSWFGVAAALLGVAGTYGLVAFVVLRQKRELGIRAALGAGSARLMLLVTMRALGPAVAGALTGIVLASWASKALSATIAGVSAVGHVPPVLAGIALVMASAAAALIAARGIRHLRASDLLKSA